MGVSYFKCDACGKMGSDTRFIVCCDDGHRMCDCIENQFVDEETGCLIDCPVCARGGNTEQRLDIASSLLKRIHRAVGSELKGSLGTDLENYMSKL